MNERLPAAERFNLISHALGGVAALVGLVWLVVRAGSLASALAFGIYGATLVFMYGASVLHHALPAQGEGAKFRRLDHIAIYALIAGTYTPCCALLLPPRWGLPLLVLVWAMGLWGIARKLFFPLAPRWQSTAAYLLMGWIVVPAAPAFVAGVPPVGLGLIAGGGLVYTLGAIIYACEAPDWFPQHLGHHGIWHIFVLAGSGMHFAFMVLFVPA